MDEFTGVLILLGFITGMCIGSVIVSVQHRYEPRSIPPHMEKLIFGQRDSLRALRLDFNKFRENHERELMQLLRETLRTSPRSVGSNDEEPNAS